MSTCKSCKYRNDDECRRHPPHVSVVMIPSKSALSGMSLNPSPVAAFPNVNEDLWCGEYAPKMALTA